MPLETPPSFAPPSTSSKGQTQARPNYFKDIQPLFLAKCAQCHGEGSSIGNWQSYDVALAKKEAINNRVFVVRDMPMVGTLTDEERLMIAKWVEAGALSGEPLQ